MPTWRSPSEIEKGVSPAALDPDQLMFYHDQMHIFWERIKEGIWFDWTFVDVYLMHKAIVIELLRRGMEHLSPVNNLDEISFVKDVKELTKIINYVRSKKSQV